MLSKLLKIKKRVFNECMNQTSLIEKLKIKHELEVKINKSNDRNA